MKVHRWHPWTIDLDRAAELQRELAGRVRRSGACPAPVCVAGADVAYDSGSGRGFGAVVVLNWPALEVQEIRTAVAPVRFPYVPGFLSFREMPVLLRAFARVRARPDVIFCDGQGVAHPRGLGLASHLGLFLDCPTIGCAKSRFVGEHEEPGPGSGDRVPLRLGDREVGAVMRTRPGAAPLYVSVGHRIRLDRACALVLASVRDSRVPEPTRIADRAVARLKRVWLTGACKD